MRNLVLTLFTAIVLAPLALNAQELRPANEPQPVVPNKMDRYPGTDDPRRSATAELKDLYGQVDARAYELKGAAEKGGGDLAALKTRIQELDVVRAELEKAISAVSSAPAEELEQRISEGRAVRERALKVLESGK